MSMWSKVKEDFKKATENGKLIGSGKAVNLSYLGGHPKIKAGGEVIVAKGSNQNTLLIGSQEIEVLKLEWDEKGQRSAGKAAAGAIIGGVLTGGIGLLAGAALGGRKKDNSLAVVSFKEGVLEGNIYFRCDQKEYQKLSNLLY
ncbi:hypothetical protein QFZ77_005406 [Paenibacillus sp. V4I3]|uniref:hypothetical protein n=1 Tax=Paenibacillus sp. V4I3 TaxID=3042305 RepID=UPI00278B6C61|nr:hypothetical protein [Paenibacillus sp. V4I3]MDQ0876747.1 hypothetical protein [Paenibacillus sp. V4I3]